MYFQYVLKDIYQYNIEPVFLAGFFEKSNVIE